MSGNSDAIASDWVRCQSKSRPDRFYMYNKKTGETTWCNNNVNSITSQKTVSVRAANDIVKTPAQDRLKRLQSNLRAKKLNEPITTGGKGGRLLKKVEPRHGKKPEESKSDAEAASDRVLPSVNEKKPAMIANPSKSQATASVETGLKIFPKEKPSRPAGEVASNEGKSKTRPPVHKFVKPKTMVSRLSSSSEEEKPPKSKSKPQSLVQQTTTKRTAQEHQSSDSCKRPFNSTTKSERSPLCSPKKVKISDDKPSIFVDSTEKKLIHGSSNAIIHDVNDNEELLKKSEKPSLMSTFKDICQSFVRRLTKPNKRVPSPTRDKRKPKNLSLNSKPSFKSKKPDNSSALRDVLLGNESGIIQKELPHKVSSPISVPKDGANARLQRLRNSLQLQQTANSSSPNTPVTSFTQNMTLDSSNVNSSLCSPSVSTSECEPMDWQPISEDIPENVTNTSHRSNIQSADSSGISEHYDTVNENLMRLGAEKKQFKEWKLDHFYFVVDTNVFLENMTFVEDLTTMKLCDTVGTLIYVPYCVLQELDKLKIRSPSESIKIRSARAIKYLNRSFQGKNQHIQAQSAADEAKHLIRVTSPDDSILNCCLQVMRQVENVLLLTEDINLRNKAMSNDIMVSTKSDLVSKHESTI